MRKAIFFVYLSWVKSEGQGTFCSNEWVLFCFCVVIRDRVSLCFLTCPGTFYIYLFILNYIHMCVCVCVCIHECRFLRRPEEGIRSLIAGVPGSCEPHYVGALC